MLRGTHPSTRDVTRGWPLPTEQALTLGLLHGPAELLPVSSSAHTLLAGYLAGWRYEQLEGSRRKSFELALHAGTASALALVYRNQVLGNLRGLRPRQLAPLMLAIAPPALVGYLFEDQIERRLSRPVPTAVGLLAGALGMAVADLRGQRDRSAEQAGHIDALALGVAQVLALAPGVSRNGATLTVARARGFDAESAQRLSWQVGAPVILGASLLRGLRLVRGRAPAQDRKAMSVGFTGAFLSSWLASRLIAPVRSLLPYCLYRVALSVLVLIETRRRGRSRSATAL